MRLSLKRIYDEPSSDDGIRILIDRLWPRGISKEHASIDEWREDLAPSTKLRQWFHTGSNRNRFEEFSKRYRKELQENKAAVSEIQKLADKKKVTLLTATSDIEHSYLTVLRDVLEKA